MQSPAKAKLHTPSHYLYVILFWITKDGSAPFETFLNVVSHEIVYEPLFPFNSEERDDARSKLWYWQDILLETSPVEVQLDMETNPRIHVMPDHALILHNITPGDAGFYYCLKYSFLLDGKPNIC